MKEIIAKKYIKALLANTNDSQLEDLKRYFTDLSSAFTLDKFKNIINSPSIPSKDKFDFVLSLVDNPNPSFINLLKLLSDSKRFDIIPELADEFFKQKSIKDRVYTGIVTSSCGLSQDEIALLEKKFSEKFSSTIKLESQVSDYNGVKVELNDLGYEISFSLDRLRSQMSEYILKAI